MWNLLFILIKEIKNQKYLDSVKRWGIQVKWNSTNFVLKDKDLSESHNEKYIRYGCCFEGKEEICDCQGFFLYDLDIYIIWRKQAHTNKIVMLYFYSTVAVFVMVIN